MGNYILHNLAEAGYTMSNSYFQDRANKEGRPVYVGPDNINGGPHWVYPTIRKCPGLLAPEQCSLDIGHEGSCTPWPCLDCVNGKPRKYETNYYEGKWVHHDGNGSHLSLCKVQREESTKPPESGGFVTQNIKDGETVCEHGSRPFECAICRKINSENGKL